jgi:very-short-patch-repair endonuclease
VGKALRDAFEGELKIPVGFRGSPLNYYTLVGASAMNRSRTWGNITGYQERGIAYYRWEAALDERMCFPKGTKVLTDRKEKSIETIQPGWKVFTDQLRFKRVKAISKTKYKGQMNRIIAKNKKIECTSDHLIMIYRNDQIMWVEAKNIKRGDYLIKRKTGGKCKECGKEYHLQPLQNRKFSIERMNYCCQECYNKYRQRKNWTEITCKNCGKNKKVRKIYVDRNQYKCCSEKCRRNYELKGLKPEDLYQICKRCGKKYRAKPKEILNKTRSYCSEECYRPPQYLICKNCKIRFRYVPSEIVHRRFCSNGCYKSYTGETRFQKKVRKFIESKGVFIENEVQYNRFVVDFFLPIHQMAIEADGTYWHSKPGIKERDARKDKLLKDNGIQVIRISEECLERDLKKLGKILK